MTIKEAAQRIGKSVDTIRRAIRNNKLDAKKVDGVWYISEEALTAYAEAQGYIGIAEGYASPYEQVVHLRRQNEKLLEQIERLQDDLRMQKERSDTLLLQLTRQLENQQHLLEYHQTSWWRRWFGRRREVVESDSE